MQIMEEILALIDVQKGFDFLTKKFYQKDIINNFRLI